MRFLVDNSLSPLVAEQLDLAGHDTAHVRDRQMQRATDQQIFDLAYDERRIVVTADTDFGAILALRQTTIPSVILFRRSSQRHPLAQVDLLLSNLDNISESLERGCIAAFDDTRLRVRMLPIGGGE